MATSWVAEKSVKESSTTHRIQLVLVGSSTSIVRQSAARASWQMVIQICRLP